MPSVIYLVVLTCAGVQRQDNERLTMMLENLQKQLNNQSSSAAVAAPLTPPVRVRGKTPSPSDKPGSAPVTVSDGEDTAALTEATW